MNNDMVCSIYYNIRAVSRRRRRRLDDDLSFRRHQNRVRCTCDKPNPIPSALLTNVSFREFGWSPMQQSVHEIILIII